MTFNFITGEAECSHETDDSCYTVRDIAYYLQKKFKGRKDVPKQEVSDYLFEHPVFPVRDYSRKTYHALSDYYDAIIHRETITFSDRS